MIEIVMNDIEPATLRTLNNEQRSLLRNVVKYTFRNVSVTEIEPPNTQVSNQKPGVRRGSFSPEAHYQRRLQPGFH
jgi:hypothetical protein